MKEELIKRFKESYDNLSRILGDQYIAEQVIQYDFYLIARQCFKGDCSNEWEDYGKELLIELFKSLGSVIEFRTELWKEIYHNTEVYRGFHEEYGFPEYFSFKEVGTFWTKYIDELDDEPMNIKVQILHQLEEYKNWFIPYCKVFTYQYWVEHPCSLIFDLNYLPILQYWEYREAETSLKELSDLPLCQRLKKINCCCFEDEFARQFPDRETLFFDFIERGISISEAIQITRRIRTGGCRLTNSMQGRLIQAGYSNELIDTMKHYGYVKTWARTVVKILFVSNLLKG